MGARTGADGSPILLLDQDRTKWDWTLIGHAFAALEKAQAQRARPGSYQLQAAIAACHARARRADETDWHTIADLYDQLAALTPSPVIELNRAVAYGMAHGPDAGLMIVDELKEEPLLQQYHLLPSVRGDFLFRLGRLPEARAEFERAAELTRNERERAFLLQRAAESGAAPN
jgi:predicted RNA polymerase sigma factor